MVRATSNGVLGFDRASKRESMQGRGADRYNRLLAGITERADSQKKDSALKRARPFENSVI